MLGFISKTYYTIGEAAERLGVCRRTLRLWDKKNILKPTINELNKYRLYKKEDIEAFIEKALDLKTKKVLDSNT